MKNGGRIPWNATAICQIFRIFYLMGRHPMKGPFGVPFNVPVIPLGAITLFLGKTNLDCISLKAKDLPGIFLGHA